MNASEKGHLNCVEELLAATGIEKDAKTITGNTALMIASRAGHKEVVVCLIKHGANVNEKNNEHCTALMNAIQHGHLECADALLDVDCIDVHARASTGRTVLMMAADKGYVNCAQHILNVNETQNKITTVNFVNEADNDGITALMLAARSGHSNVTRFLFNILPDVIILPY